MAQPENFEIVSPERLKELLRAERVLELLHAAGVDDWEWYDIALADLEEDA